MYTASETRYDQMTYNRCGGSGIMLPALSLGLWHTFGNLTPFGVQQSILRTAFDAGICHFDLANNYGPPYGEAERNFGIHMDRDWKPYRDELFISTKAGYDMWAGPYGDHGSKKYLISSLDQSLKRMHLDYVDVFYHHRPDPETPMEETMEALAQIVRSGKALYVGVSNYSGEEMAKAAAILKDLGIHCLITQPRYSLLERGRLEGGLDAVLRQEKIGCIVYSPLANGILTGKYLNGIPADSRVAKDPRYLKADRLTPELTEQVSALNGIAVSRGQKLHQMALQWVLRDPVVTTALIGVSRPEQISDNLAALSGPPFTAEELARIDAITAGR